MPPAVSRAWASPATGPESEPPNHPSNYSRSRLGYGTKLPIGRLGSMNFRCPQVGCLRVTPNVLPGSGPARGRNPTTDHNATQVLV